MVAEPEVSYLVPNVGRYRGIRGGVGMHQHEEAEVLLIRKSSCVLEVGGQFLSAGEGDFVILPPDIPHAQEDQGPTETLYGLFRSGSFPIREEARVLKLGPDPYLGRWYLDLVNLFKNPEDAPSSTADSLMMSILSRIGSWENRHKRQAVLHPAVSQTLTLLESDYRRDLSISELARAVGFSPSHLRSLFREQMGLSPNRYIQKLRLRAARQHLRSPYLSIKEVAYLSGFSDPNYFSRHFRKEEGVSPREWRLRQGL